MKQPPLGLTTTAEVVRVIDGDTVQVKIERTITVRLVDCWACEKNTPHGLLAELFLTELLEGGSAVVLHIPGSEREFVGDLLTFGRFLGRLWKNGQDVSEIMVASGHASKTKNG